MVVRSLLLAAALCGPLAMTGCAKKAPAADEAKTYATRGAIKSFGPDKRFVNIAHEAIPGYMAAMTMSFEPKTASQLDGVAAGDKVAFSFSDDGGHRVITTITKEP